LTSDHDLRDLIIRLPVKCSLGHPVKEALKVLNVKTHCEDRGIITATDLER
jgi:hypothetical protein